MPMIKRPNCRHQFDAEPCCQPAYLNEFECDRCDVSWTDTWSCGCDDECSSCGTAISPVRSEQIAPCACRYLGH